MRAYAWTLVAAASIVGCYRSTTLPSRDGGTGDGAAQPRDAFVPPDATPWPRDGAPPPGIVFRPCEGAFGGRMAGAEVECAYVRVPRRAWDLTGGTIELVVERIRPLGVRVPRAQLWMLQGGPGGSSLSFEVIAPFLQRTIEDVEILLVDHRGTGLASRLGCAREEAIESPGGTSITLEEWPSCIESLRAAGHDLREYTSLSAAYDLDFLIERARRSGVPVFVYGVSYGTYWAQRWMEIRTARVDGVILDSICSPGECTFPIGFSRGHDEIGRELLRACGADAACSARIGTADAVGWAERIMARIAGGSCEAASRAGLDAGGVRFAAGALLRDAQLRNVIPALFHRLERCASEDTVAFQTLGRLLRDEWGDEMTRLSFAPVLAAVVLRSEMWELPPPAEAEYERARAAMLFDAPVEAPLGPFATLDATPTYSVPPLAFVSIDVPILMMNGSLDPQTTIADATPAGEHYAGPAQHFVVFERAAHGTLFSTSREPGRIDETCGMEVAAQFVRDPRGPIDTSCRTSLPPIDFEDESLAGVLFGTTSLWEPRIAAPILGPEADAIRARIRELVARPL